MRIVERWKTLTDKIVQKFIERYFDIDSCVDAQWVDTFHIFEVNDYFFNFSDAVFCLENDVLEDKLFDWYDKSVTQEINMSLKDFLESPEKLKEQRENHLKELEKRVKVAEKEFKKALSELP